MSEIKNSEQSAIGVVMPSIYLQQGMRVKIKNNTKDFMFNAGEIKTITKLLPDFGKNRAFELDNDSTGIWCIEDFDFCVDYPDMVMS